MKKLFLIIFAIFLLCSCSAEPAEPIEEQESFSADTLHSETPLPDEETQARVKEYIETEAVDYNTRLHILEDKGCSAFIRNAVIRDGCYFGAELVLTKGEKEIIIPIEGFYETEHPICWFGCFTKYDEENFVFCGNKNAVIVNFETFEARDFYPELPDYGTKELWINVLVHDPEEKVYYIAASPNGEKTDYSETLNSRFLIFDEKGNLLSDKEINYNFFGGHDYFATPAFLHYTHIDRIFGKKLIIRTGQWSDGGTFFDTEDGTLYTYTSFITAKNGDYDFRAFKVGKINDDITPKKTAFFLYENGEKTDEFKFDLNVFEPEYNVYPWFEITGEPQPFELDGKTASYYDEKTGSLLEADFENQVCNVTYKIDEDMFGEIIAESSDKSCTLYSSGAVGMGDIMTYGIVHKNNETGKITYLSEGGGMYGGGTSQGFLKNGDCYVLDYDKLKIYDKNAEKIFDLSDNFELGYDPETGSERGLLTFRRDPEDFSYIVVYFEYENGIEWNYVETGKINYNEGNCNYKIGFLDSEGKLIESYDSGQGILSSPFGIESVDMRYSEEELRLFVSSRKGSPIMEIVFDTETKEFEVLKTY